MEHARTPASAAIRRGGAATRSGILLLAALALVVSLAPVAGARTRPDEALTTVHTFADLATVADAEATLRRSPEALRATIDTGDLPPGQVMTLWWVVFNNPEECRDGAGSPCGVPDLFDPDVETGCLFGDGGTVRHDGRIRLRGSLAIGDVRDSCLPFFGAPDHGLIDPVGAEVHLVVRSHGPRLPRQLRAQRTTFAGGCEVFLDQGAEVSAPGECADQQFAMFPAAA